jgi:hypothetical protein
MPTRKLSSDDAFELAAGFRQASVALGDYRFAKWEKLKPSERRALEDAEWDLLTLSGSVTTKAVGLVLDETELSLARLQGATATARKAIKDIKRVKKVIKVATALVGLAAAVYSQDFGLVVKNAKAVHDAATEDA